MAKKQNLILFGFLIFLLWPAKSFAASLYISPAGGGFGVGATFTVTVRTDTQGQAVNTAEAGVSFSTDTLQLVRVAGSPVFYLQAPGSPASGNGTAYFGGGVPAPGYNGANGTVGTMTFRALREGTATVSVTGGKVLLNDGLGTDALSATAGARYAITPPAVGMPEVSSASHPDQSRWYNAKDPAVSWSRPEGAYGFSFELDQNPETIPDNTLDTTITTAKTYPGLADGVWYFHIKSRRQTGAAFGNTAHFKIQIDTEVPKLFDIKLAGQSDLNDVTRTPTIEFQAEDPGGSGIDHYDAKIDDRAALTNVISPYTFTKLEPGPHIIRVTAFDKAGNTRKSELPIIVNAPAGAGFLQKSLELPILLVLAMNLLIIILLTAAIWLLVRARRPSMHMTAELKGLKLEVDESLDKLRRQIDRKLVKLYQEAANSKGGPELRGQIAGTKKQIDSDIKSASAPSPRRRIPIS